MRNFLVLTFLVIFFNPALGADFSINVSWFEDFDDNKLTEYICLGLEHNKDVIIARKNILKYRQEKNLKISKLFPEINVGVNYLLLKVPQLAIPDNDIQTNSFALPFTAFWELDYLGKNYNQVQKSKKDIENKLLDTKSAGLIVASDIALTYLNISNTNEEIELEFGKTKNLETILNKKKKLFEYGTISSDEVNSAEEEYLKEVNKIHELNIKKETYMMELAYLMGISPLNINSIKINDFKNIEYKGKYPNEIKSDTIYNRPDIIKAENELKKAGIDITIAKKEFLPSINIIGILGFSTILQKFDWATAIAALSTGAVQNIFDGGKRIFNFKLSKINYEIMLENYLKAELNALKEVNGVLYTLKKNEEIFNTNKKRHILKSSNLKKAAKRLEYGVINEIEYLNENNEELTQKIKSNESKMKTYESLISLYKATGGGSY